MYNEAYLRTSAGHALCLSIQPTIVPTIRPVIAPEIALKIVPKTSPPISSLIELSIDSYGDFNL